MKFVDKTTVIMFADTHGSLKYDKLAILERKMKKYKIHGIFTLGDIKIDELLKIQEFADEHNIINLYGVLGNHDKENYFNNTHIKNLHENKCLVNHIYFAGWQGSFKNEEDAYIGYTQKQSLQMVDNIPYADVLISHDQPKQENSSNHHQGLNGIKKYMNDGKAQLNFHGHTHNKKINNSSIGIYRCAIVTIYKIFGKKILYKIKYVF